MNKKSYEAHNTEYEAQDKFEQENAQHKKSTGEKAEFKEDNQLGKIIFSHPEIKIGVDIGAGAGTGWYANLLSTTKEVVFAIKRSKVAVDIGKK